MNKSRKLVNTIENINSINELSKKKNNYAVAEKTKENLKGKNKSKVKKTKTKKKIRTLWVRRKKKI